MKFYIVIPILTAFLITVPAELFCAGAGQGVKAENLFLQYRYAEAAAIYRTLNDVQNPDLNNMKRLAECYKKMNQYEDAEIWYARIVNNPASEPEDILNYGEILKANAKYSSAKKAFQQYYILTRDKNSVATLAVGCDSANKWISRPTDHRIQNESLVNTNLSEFAAFPVADNLVYYTGEPAVVNDKKKIYGWTGNAYLRIFDAGRNPDNSLNWPRIPEFPFNDEPYHVGPVSSNKAGTIFFITRTYPGKKGLETVIDGNTYQTQNMELYIQAKIYGVWDKPHSFAFNDVQRYSVGHAALSPDESILYFVSDKSDGEGGTDIWFSELQSDGTWGEMKNAGKRINTSGNELFPSVAADGTLYFASNGHPGMGGLDIFSSRGSRESWSRPVNLRYPINSPRDDFAFFMCRDNMGGYLSSNRENGKGNDDIYSFELTESSVRFFVAGVVVNKKTNEPLRGSDVILYDQNKNIIAKQESNKDGAFLFSLAKPEDGSLFASLRGFLPDSLSIDDDSFIAQDTLWCRLYLEPLLEVGKIFRLKPIFYNFDKYNIRSDAAVILDELVLIMHENPTLNIELGSHTDCRGTDDYNQRLSQNRAQSVVDYLVSRGIARDRMVVRGYGEARLVNRCADGVDCSEEEHQENRRTEFTVLSW
ncbi:MAG: OmpA family protein [Bacteroidales bacterium]|nr:OmpA family protein [Bacteroidales bacterium]